MNDHATYVARIEPDDYVRVYASDVEYPVASIYVPPGASLRDVLAAAGWMPTGQRAPGGGWSRIYVAPTRPLK